MRALSAGELLEVWEYGASQPLVQRALELLEAACPEISRDALAALSIGERDARMLMLREELWGPEMTAFAPCPACREKLELALDTREILASPAQKPPEELSLSIAGYSLTFRLPTSLEMIAASRRTDLEECRALILERCLVSARHGDTPIGADELPEEVTAGVAHSMAEADPLADIQFRLTCPCCEHEWRAPFDIVAFLWTEIEVWARRILGDVHALAAAYGWSEREILSLTPVRRQFYLEMVGA